MENIIKGLNGFPTKDIKEEKLIQRGDIFLVDLDGLSCKISASLQTGKRPCLISSNNANNKFSTIISVIPLTSQTKASLPTHVLLGEESGLIKQSLAICEQMISIPKDFVLYKLCECSEEKMHEIDRAIKIQQGMINPKQIDLEYINKSIYMIRRSTINYERYHDDYDLIVKSTTINELKKYCYDHQIPYDLIINKTKVNYINIYKNNVMVG